MIQGVENSGVSGMHRFFSSSTNVLRRTWKPALGGSAALFGLWSQRTKDSGYIDKSLPKRWTLKTGTFCLSKDDPVSKLSDVDFYKRLEKLNGNCCGEDSYTVVENEEQMVIAIADGVGGWRKRGIDPAQFSRCLMDQVREVVANSRNKLTNAIIGADEILKKAFYGLVQVYMTGKGKPFGSSTACIVSLQKRDGTLDVANLGDSGMILIRDGNVLFKTEVQQTRFNAPFQTTLRPNGNVDDMTPMAARTIIPIQEGDIIVLATDGILDNLWERDLVDTVVGRLDANIKPSPTILSALAKDLVMKSRDAAVSEKDSPFAVEAQKNGKSYRGGKPDDMTVIVSIVSDNLSQV